MNKLYLSIPLLLGLAGSATLVLGDDDEREYGQGGWFSQSRLDVAPVDNPSYREECGGCHLPYQPGLLPARSWEKMMASLDDHFGENAELDSETNTSIRNYLVANAADQSSYKRSQGINRSLSDDETPLRITETRYFQRKHHEIPLRYVKDNPEVGSFSRCQACHTNAEKGSYNEHEVRIPGAVGWED